MKKELLNKLNEKEWQLPYSDKIIRVIHNFSLTEKIIFFIFVTVFVISSISLLWKVNKSFLVEVPDYGGTLIEGVIGSARFLNPLLSVSEIDRDLSSLVYSGLLKVNSQGQLIPDLAQSYSLSNDSLTYTFILKDNIYFHDGQRVTADDILFTIEKAQDPALKSPRQLNWGGVKVEKVDDKTVKFSLKQAYSPFIQNTTLGILPKHIWKSTSIEEFPFSKYNLNPVGSGPYKIDSIAYSSSSLPIEYHLKAYNRYNLGKPYITYLVIKSFQSEKDLVSAFSNGSVDNIHGLSPQEIPENQGQMITSPLPRIFAVFFNQNNAPVFVNKEVRLALNLATDKETIVKEVLGGLGEPIDQALPPNKITQGQSTSTSNNIDKAKALLVSKGWKQNSSGIFEKKGKKSTVQLSFSISTSDAPDLKATAYILQKQWQQLGAKVEVKIFEINDLNQNIIRTRKYDSLLFGEIIGRDLDLYPFWHSSQRNDPGLNIAMYTNIKADKILENLRKTTDLETQKKLYANFNNELANDSPAVFIYSPYFTYYLPKKVHNASIGNLSTATERFAEINKWYIETNNVWSIFIK